MVDFKFVVECLRRRWYVAVAALVIAIAAAFFGGFATEGGKAVTATYRAECVVYFEGFESAAGSYNYELTDGAAIADMRRIIESDTVAGETRRQYGQDVTIGAYTIKDKDTSQPLNIHFLSVVASAPNIDTAMAAAQSAAERSVAVAKEKTYLKNAQVYEGPFVNNAGELASNRGTGALDVQTQEVVTAKSISWKKLVVFGGVGFILGFVIVMLYELMRQKVRCPRDVERLFGVMNLSELSVADKDNAASFAAAAVAVDALAKGNDIESFAVVGFGPEDCASETGAGLASCAKSQFVGAASVADNDQLGFLAQADAVVLSIVERADSPDAIKKAVQYLKAVNVPVLGAVYFRR